MAESPMVGCRVPTSWQDQIRQIASATGKKEADVVREALGQYLGAVNPGAVKSVLANHEERIAKLESKLASFVRLAV